MLRHADTFTRCANIMNNSGATLHMLLSYYYDAGDVLLFYAAYYFDSPYADARFR